MTSSQPSQPRSHLPAVLALALLVAAVTVGLRGGPVDTLSGDATPEEGAAPTVVETPRVTRAIAAPRLAAALDTTTPDVANLDPDLRDALLRAATDAARDGVVFTVNSGWRSAERQEGLLREAVSEYGSEEAAARWVATPETSPHVSGDAVDLGGGEATSWLSRKGDEYGLCQIYRNEPWHYELRPEAVEQGCPRMYADPTQDPRMQ